MLEHVLETHFKLQYLIWLRRFFMLSLYNLCKICDPGEGPILTTGTKF